MAYRRFLRKVNHRGTHLSSPTLNHGPLITRMAASIRASSTAEPSMGLFQPRTAASRWR